MEASPGAGPEAPDRNTMAPISCLPLNLITSTGAFLQHETLTMSSQGRSMTIDETARDGRTGLPLTRVLHISGGGQNAEISVTFSSSAAKVQAKAPNGSKSSTIPAPKGANLHNASEFWFLRDRPSKGAKVTYYGFDLNRMQWKRETDTYVGEETISVGGRKVRAHKITTTDGPQWLDDRGFPYKLELTGSNIVMVRK